VGGKVGRYKKEKQKNWRGKVWRRMRIGKEGRMKRRRSRSKMIWSRRKRRMEVRVKRRQSKGSLSMNENVAVKEM
jgi:hypothetical protein